LPPALWQRLGEPIPARDQAATSALRSELESLAGWVGERETELPQAIELLAAIDALVMDPSCEPCRAQIQALLWPLLPSPAAAIGPRATSGASGAAYLEALESVDSLESDEPGATP
jgi:hypothetical protein